jgi:hypothetical protein
VDDLIGGRGNNTNGPSQKIRKSCFSPSIQKGEIVKERKGKVAARQTFKPWDFK